MSKKLTTCNNFEVVRRNPEAIKQIVDSIKNSTPQELISLGNKDINKSNVLDDMILKEAKLQECEEEMNNSITNAIRLCNEEQKKT